MACQCQQLPVGAQTAPTYLPSSCRKHVTRTEYSDAAEAVVEVVRQKTFCVFGKFHQPTIQIKNPSIDLCAKCDDLCDIMNCASSEFQELNI